jgi:hypothetical protein
MKFLKDSFTMRRSGLSTGASFSESFVSSVVLSPFSLLQGAEENI